LNIPVRSGEKKNSLRLTNSFYTISTNSSRPMLK
jgi:hypothetical protein